MNEIAPAYVPQHPDTLDRIGIRSFLEALRLMEWAMKRRVRRG